MDFYKRALALREETISHRRWLHSNAEVGLHMPKGQTYVMEQLRGYGLDPHPCGHGVIAELGQEGGRTILLRADMDALPMPEESGESFSCALPGFVDSKNEEKTERNAGYLVVSHSGGGMLRQGTRKGIRRTPANRGMRAHWVVKGLDISEDVCHGMCP